MNTADVAAEVKCLRRLIGMRCSNVYDLSPKVTDTFYYNYKPHLVFILVKPPVCWIDCLSEWSIDN